MEAVTARLLRIHGRVQGVGYRESMRREAERLHLRGWVRNRSDGTVEALVCGPAPHVASLLQWAQRGPRCAVVERVAVLPAEPAPAPGFMIRGTE